MAAFAGLCGVLGIASSIAIPILAAMHHRHVSPESFFFGVYGFVALCGAAGCIHTYFISGDRPDKPPHGGVPVRELRLLEGGKARAESNDEQKHRAA